VVKGSDMNPPLTRMAIKGSRKTPLMEWKQWKELKGWKEPNEFKEWKGRKGQGQKEDELANKKE
jgi:hypothetical protein